MRKTYQITVETNDHEPAWLHEAFPVYVTKRFEGTAIKVGPIDLIDPEAPTYAFTEEERQALIGAIHLSQDMYAETSDDLAGAEHPDDRQAGRDAEKRADILDVVRRK